MFIGWLTCISQSLRPHSLCRFTTANAPANRQMPIASVVTNKPKKKEKEDRDRATQHENSTITTLDNKIFLPKKQF